MPAGERGRDRAARPEGLQGLLARPRGDRGRLRRRLVPHRRHRRARRRRLPLHRRPAQGHDRLRRARTSPARRSSACSTSTTRCSRRRWWAVPTIAGARSRWPSSSCGRVRPPRRTRCSSTVVLSSPRFKVPKEITFLDALPAQPVGQGAQTGAAGSVAPPLIGTWGRSGGARRWSGCPARPRRPRAPR